MARIRLSKIGIPEAPGVRSGLWSTFEVGSMNTSSLPLGYWLEGDLMLPIRTGQRVLVRRSNRNGKMVEGLFRSSLVIAYDGHRLETTNSIYRVEKLGELRVRDLPEDERQPFAAFLAEHRCMCPAVEDKPIEEQDGYHVGDYAAWRAGRQPPDELDMS